MSNRVTGQALRIVAFAGLAIGSASLAGCSSLGGFNGPTGSIAPATSSGGSQAMPQALKPISTQVAEGPFTPPEDIGGGSGGLVTGSVPVGTVSSSTLPPLTGNVKMSAQPQLAPLPVKTASLGNVSTPAPSLSVVPANAYTHVIQSGESLYTIARHYDVTAQAIMQANGLSAPDKIFVGQKIIIPGRADLLAAKDVGVPKVAAVEPMALAPAEAPLKVPSAKPAAITTPKLASPDTTAAAPVQVASLDPAPPKIAPVEPVMSGADKFRWPVSGKVITDFIASKGTGINIDAPEGTAVRAAENGQVIYVGSGVEGYGNLVLIRHPNGYVSAYAHLKSISVVKGANVNRGDSIGLVGMTGSVSRPQLHFELRQGATPVDPIPLLAG